MRIIKFRVYNTKTKQWIHEGPREPNKLDGVNLFGESILLGYFMDVSFDDLNDCVALQFTGLQDRNGRDIFEGDLIKLRCYDGWHDEDGKEFIFEVAWCKLSVGFRAFRSETAKKGYSGLDFDKNCEVVGNIYDNPELLNNNI